MASDFRCCITSAEHFSQVYVKRQDSGLNKRQGGANDVNTLPETVATKAPNGQLEPYVKRQGGANDINTLPETVATKAPNGQTVPY